MKRLASPYAWGVGRKTPKWAPKTVPGAHKQLECMPLVILLREKLQLAANAREVKRALNEGLVLVDGRKIKEGDYGVGLMDVISIPCQNKYYRILSRGRRLEITEISEKQANVKYAKVLDKRMVRGGKVQISLHDGRNQLVEKEEDRFKPGDTIKFKVPEQKLEGFVKFEKGAKCFVYRGRHAGEFGELVEVIERAGSKDSDARIKTPKGEIITLSKYLFVVDDEFDKGKTK